jgi:hypothetical protein
MSGVAMNTCLVETATHPTNVPTKRAKLSKEEAAAKKKELAEQKTEFAVKKKQSVFDKQKRALEKQELILESMKRRFSVTESALKKMKNEHPQAEQPQVEQPQVEDADTEQSDSDESEGDPTEEAFAEFNERKVDILSDAVIAIKLQDLPVCYCGGHCICLKCKNKYNVTLTQKNCTGSNAPRPGEEYICIRDTTRHGDETCHIDGVGYMPCVICLTDEWNSDPLKWAVNSDASCLIGEAGVCPNCCVKCTSSGKCHGCSYPIKFMHD